MSGHLPDCLITDFGYGICICDRLLACEARVKRDYMDLVDRHGAALYSKALDAAHEAVVARYVCNCDAGIRARSGIRGIDGKPHWHFCVTWGAVAALAAIDALRGES